MGFGLLLIGYTFAYLITIGLGTYAFVGMIIGHFMMYLALGELKKYSPVFNYAYILSVMLILCSGFECVSGVDSMLSLGLSLSSTKLASIMEVTRFLLDAGFNIAFLYGIIDLSKRVDYTDTKDKSYRNMVFVGLYYIFQIVISALADNPGETYAKYASFMMTVALLFKLMLVFFNIGLIFKCYAFICPSEDLEMKRKPSRFAFINKIREKTDANEERAIEDTKRYFEEKAKKKREKLEAKNNSINRSNNKKKKK